MQSNPAFVLFSFNFIASVWCLVAVEIMGIIWPTVGVKEYSETRIVVDSSTGEAKFQFFMQLLFSEVFSTSIF